MHVFSMAFSCHYTSTHATPRPTVKTRETQVSIGLINIHVLFPAPATSIIRPIFSSLFRVLNALLFVMSSNRACYIVDEQPSKWYSTDGVYSQVQFDLKLFFHFFQRDDVVSLSMVQDLIH